MAKLLGLEDVEAAAASNPDTFFIPDRDERESQKVGDEVRLHFLLQDSGPDEPRAERIWVKITQADGKAYKGVLQSSPVSITELAIDDEISFEPRHVARTVIKKGDPRWIDSGELKAFVSNMCLEKGNVIRFLYREEADGDEDSGWRMFSGQEPQDYVDVASNITAMNVGFLLNRDPTLLEPLKGSAGDAFERDDAGSPWRKVTDWSPGGD